MPRGYPKSGVRKRFKRRTWEPIYIEDGAVGIPLPGGMVAIVDAADLPLVVGRNWRAHWTGARWYVRATVPPRVYLHNLFIPVQRGQDVDHRDRDWLNNRRHNLRGATRSQNNCNTVGHFRDLGKTSRFKGVHWDTRKGRWAAQIKARDERAFLGYYESEIDAAMAYDEAVASFHGEFAYRNFAEPPNAD